MTVLFGLIAAMTAGTSDFLGGLASRKTPAIRVTAAAQAMGALLTAVGAAVLASSAQPADFAWGAMGGVTGALGLLALYAGYANARVGIAAPVAGVGAAALPAIVDAFADGEPLGGLALVGVIVGLLAVALVSMQGGGDAQGSVSASLMYGVCGGVGLGLLLVGLSRAGDDSGLWPLAASRFTGSAAVLAVMAVTREQMRVPKIALPHIVGIAVLGAIANAAFIAASRSGSTAVAAVITSLFPAFTVGWAVIVFRERLRPVQLAGLALALVAVSLILVG